MSTNGPLFVGIGFRARSGKDTIADYLVEKHGFRKTSWADLLKLGVNLWHGWDSRHAYGDLKEVVDPYFGYTPRHAYQHIGTNCIRDHHRHDFWTVAAMKQINEWMDQGISVVVPDCRFTNEAAVVLGTTGGQLWKVTRPGLPPPNPPPKNRLVRFVCTELLGKKYDHESEIGLLYFKAWSAVIRNEGSKEDLYKKVDFLLGKVDE